MKISAIRTAYAAIVLVGIVYAFIVLRGEKWHPGLNGEAAPGAGLRAGQPEAHREIELKKNGPALQENPTEQEYEIRQRLKLARPGERSIFWTTEKVDLPRANSRR